MRVELHCHTVRSWDGYTSIESLVAECRRKGIDAVSVTEHDRFKLTQAERDYAAREGVLLIPACEVTTTTGFHLIGLFLRSMPMTGTGPEVVRAIRAQGGLISIPHPHKPGTGLLGVCGSDTEVSEVLRASDFIELYNGGFDQQRFVEQTLALADRYELRCIAASDAHKPWHIGTYLTELGAPKTSSLERLQYAMRSDRPTRLLRAEGLSKRSDAPLQRQRPAIVQAMVDRVPSKLKRAVHLRRYASSLRAYQPRPVSYVDCARGRP